MSQLFVAPDGSDLSPGTYAQPFATLAKARDAARLLPSGDEKRILVRGGNYYEVSLELGQEDSGLTIEAAPGEIPILFGGRPISGWEPDGESFYAADVPGTQTHEWDFRMLLVNGRFCPRARYPEEGRLVHESIFDVRWRSASEGGWERPPTAEELTTLQYREGDLGPWLDGNNAELTVFHQWDESMVGVAHIDHASRTITFSTPAGHPPGAFITTCDVANTYVVWNVREGMTEPGQWYLDRTRGKVVYWPLPGEDMTTAAVIAPTVETIICIAGTEENPVHGITLRGLTLSVTNTPLIAGDFGARMMPGALVDLYSNDCHFEDVTISGVNGYGMRHRFCTRLLIDGCEIRMTGAGGIITGWSNGVRLTNNHIHHIGLAYPSGIGIFVRGSELQINHNEIHDASYTGIHCSQTPGCRIEHNLLYRLMQMLHDGGAVYFIDGKGVRVSQNIVRDLSSDGAHAYYIDELGEDCVIEGNLALNTGSPVHGHMSRNCIIRNNVFLDAGSTNLMLARCAGFTLAGNVISADDVLFSSGEDGIAAMPGNVIHSGTGTVEFETLGGEGYDRGDIAPLPPRDGTVYADPLFIDAAGGDYRLHPASPALRLGIAPINVSQAGRKAKNGD